MMHLTVADYNEKMNPTQYPKIGLGVIIRHKNKILLGYRTTKHAGNMWGCPGGHLEMFEDLENAAVRETLEEVDICLNPEQLEFIGLANTKFFDENKHYVVLFYLVDVDNDYFKNMEPDKCKEWKWFSEEEVKHIPMMPGFLQLMADGINPFIWSD